MTYSSHSGLTQSISEGHAELNGCNNQLGNALLRIRKIAVEGELKSVGNFPHANWLPQSPLL
jgi:hypothetical protein